MVAAISSDDAMDFFTVLFIQISMESAVIVIVVCTIVEYRVTQGWIVILLVIFAVDVGLHNVDALCQVFILLVKLCD